MFAKPTAMWFALAEKAARLLAKPHSVNQNRG